MAHHPERVANGRVDGPKSQRLPGYMAGSGEKPRDDMAFFSSYVALGSQEKAVLLCMYNFDERN